MERVNTGGLIEFRYEKDHKYGELNEKEKRNLRNWRKRRFWNIIKPYIIAILVIILGIYLTKKYLL